MKISKSTLDRDMDRLVEEYGDPAKVAEATIKGEPEIDIEPYGSLS